MRRAILMLSIATIAGLSASGLSACSHDQAAGEKYANLKSGLDKLDHAGGPTRGPITKSERVYVGANDIDTVHGDPLPDAVEAPNGFVFTGTSRGGAYTLAELCQRITHYTGMTVLIEPDKADAGQASAPAAQPANDSSIQTINKLIGADGPTQGGAPLSSRSVTAYQGPLSGFLDREIPAYGKDWDVRGNVIYIGTEVIRSYPVVDMPSTTSMSAGLSGNGSSSGSTNGTAGAAMNGNSSASSAAGQNGTVSGSGSTGGQNTVTTTSINGWSDLLSTLTGVVGSKERVYAEPSNGMVSVRCSLHCQAIVSAYIRDHNREAGRSVLLTVAILTVSKTGSDNYGISPTVIYKNLPIGYTLSVLGQSSAITPSSGGTFTAGVLNPPAGSSAAKFNGTSLAVQAISQDQEITGTFGKYGFTGNNRVFSVRNALDYSYLQTIVNSQNTVGTTSGASVTTQVVGDQLQIIPRILQNGMIRLQLALSRTAIQSQTQVTISGTTTTIPQITDNSGSPQEFNIRDGATLILSDIGDDNSNRQLSGAGSVYNWLLGGRASASNSGDRTILIVTVREWHGGDEVPRIGDL